ncbi:MAG TPA: radical SAM protein [Desulfobacterales bacterium]|nr:radical SAM protein [Desulfobacterales bacterium]
MILVLSAPVLYSLELTPACNNLCPGCSNVFAGQRERPHLTLEGWQAILDKIKPHAHLVKLTGGEPTLYPHFSGIVTYLQKLDISFSLFTNGCWPDPKHLIALLKAIPQFRGFLISLHGATPATHEAFSGVPGSFERTVGNIKRAIEAGLPVTTSTVITKQNFRELGQIAEFAESLGAHHAVFNRYLGKPLPGIEPTEEELKEAVQNIEGLRSKGAKVKFGNCIPQCFTPSSSTGCLSGVAYCTIDPWGYMRPCNHASLRCGNVLEQSVEEAWQSPEMQRWREMIPEQCHRCVEFSQCHGGCRAMAWELGIEKDPLIGSPFALKQKPPERIVLYEGWRPVRSFNVRQERFGYVLMRGNRIAPVAFEDKAVLDACDGQRTLREIEGQLGARGLKLVAQLYKKGLIEFM